MWVERWLLGPEREAEYKKSAGDFAEGLPSLAEGVPPSGWALASQARALACSLLSASSSLPPTPAL